MTRMQAIAEFEARFETIVNEIGYYDPAIYAGDGKDWSRAPTGHKYVTITNDGPKPEGKPFPRLHDTQAGAIQSWLDEASKFADGKGTTLYWREKPQLVCLLAGNPGRCWTIYSRFWIGP